MKTVFIIMGLGFVSSLSLFFYIGFGPRPLRLINPTIYENQKQIGVSVYYRLRQKLENIETIVVDDLSEVSNYDLIWQGFKAALDSDNRKNIKLVPLSSTLKQTNKKKNLKEIFIRLQPYVVDKSQISILEKKCLLSGSHYKSHKCVAVKVSQRFFRKKLPKDKLSGVLQAFGADDYHLFVYDPFMWHKVLR